MSRKLLESSDLKESSRHVVKERRAPKRGVSSDAKRREPLPRARELAGPPPLRTAASAPTQFAGEADAEATELQGGGDESFGYLVRKNTLPKARPAEFELF